MGIPSLPLGKGRSRGQDPTDSSQAPWLGQHGAPAMALSPIHLLLFLVLINSCPCSEASQMSWCLVPALSNQAGPNPSWAGGIRNKVHSLRAMGRHQVQRSVASSPSQSRTQISPQLSLLLGTGIGNYTTVQVILSG